IGAEIPAPELLFKLRAQGFRLYLKLAASVYVSEHAGQSGGCKLRGINVTLNFAQRDRRFRNFSRGIEYGIGGIFPALLHQSFTGMPGILDKAVAVHVPKFVDPFERPLNVRPQLLQKGAIRRTVEIRASEHDE